jgi:hypothetical protein
MQCKERAQVEMGRGEDQTEEEQINICICGGRHCNKGDIDARGIISEKAARVGKGQDELLVRCGLDGARRQRKKRIQLREDDRDRDRERLREKMRPRQ